MKKLTISKNTKDGLYFFVFVLGILTAMVVVLKFAGWIDKMLF